MASDDVWERLFAKLAEFGVDDKALKAAQAEGMDGIRRLVARYVSFPGARQYSPRDIYEKIGVSEETATGLWRAMGFALVPDDEVAFTEADVAALLAAKRVLDSAQMDEAVLLQQARSMSQAAARIAASQQDVIGTLIPDGDPVRAAQEVLRLAEEALPTLDRLLVYMYRRHLAAATEQQMMLGRTAEGSVPMSVGFADLSGFTAMSQELDVRQLAALIDRFNGTTSDIVAQCSGRVIKTIGDEVMFATPEAGSACEIAVTLLGDMETENLPPLKIGIASGQVLPSEGDLFGSPVNLASRLVTTAVPGSALVDEATHAAMSDDERFSFSQTRRQHLKGFGLTHAFRLRPPGQVDDKSRRHRERRRDR